MFRFFDYIRWRLTAKKRAAESKIRKAQKYNSIKERDQHGYDVCLLGDSLIEYWQILEIAGKRCFNAGVGDATSEDVLSQLNNNLLSGSFDTYVIILGTNDVKYKIPAKRTAANISKIITFLQGQQASAKIIYCTIPPVNGLWDRKNRDLEKSNSEIRRMLPNDVRIIPFASLKDTKGNLKEEYTIDGLHFTEAAYSIIQQQIEIL